MSSFLSHNHAQLAQTTPHFHSSQIPVNPASPYLIYPPVQSAGNPGHARVHSRNPIYLSNTDISESSVYGTNGYPAPLQAATPITPIPNLQPPPIQTYSNFPRTNTYPGLAFTGNPNTVNTVAAFDDRGSTIPPSFSAPSWRSAT